MKTLYIPISKVREEGFVSEFGKTLTDDQIRLIRQYNEDLSKEDKYEALETLLGWDLELICRENIE